MNYKILVCLTLLLGVMFISNVIAVDPEIRYTFEQGDKISLRNSCYNNGTYCSASADCRISILNQDNSVLVRNVTMTNADYPYWTYNLTSTQSQVLGTYKADQTCTDNGLSGSETFYFGITPSGNKDTGSNIALFILIVMVIYGIAFIGFFGKNEYVTILGGMGMLALGLYTINNGLIIYRDFITEIFSWTTIGVGAFFALYAGFSVIQDNL